MKCEVLSWLSAKRIPRHLERGTREGRKQGKNPEPRSVPKLQGQPPSGQRRALPEAGKAIRISCWQTRALRVLGTV